MVTDAKDKPTKKSPAWQDDPNTKKIEYEDVEAGDFFKFEKIGDSIAGVLVHKGTIQFSNGTVGSYKLMLPDGSEVKFNGATTLDEKMRDISVNTPVRIELVAIERTASKRPLRQWKVQRAKS